jgi:uncharacterized protein involved in response to NO
MIPDAAAARDRPFNAGLACQKLHLMCINLRTRRRVMVRKKVGTLASTPHERFCSLRRRGPREGKMMMAIPRLRPYEGPALLSYGFRPFFLFGSIYAGAAVLLWIPMFYGEISISTAFTPRDWHVHEMLFGYVVAVVTGFLLTAIPNWTGRLPIQGAPLLLLCAVWAAGRLSVTFSAFIGWMPAAVVDVAFLALVAAAAAREILAGRNWGNLKIFVVLVVLTAANVAFHLEAHARGAADYSIRLGLAALITLLMIIGGRIVPSFTRNWLARESPGRLPVPFRRFDVGALVLSGVGLALWIALPTAQTTAAVLLVGGVLQTIRLVRWAGYRTLRDRLVLVLHFAYAFVPIGFILTGLAALDLLPASAGIHAWTAGAIGTMTLAVMTRASLGHTGHALIASIATQAIYLAVLVAALTRICAAIEPWRDDVLLPLSALFWAVAFLGFGASYAPMLLSRRRGNDELHRTAK